MSAIQITITDAGRAEIINAANTGTGPVEITEVGLGTGKYTPNPTQTGLVSEIKRLSTIAGQVVSDDTIHVTVKDESADEYDVSEFGLYTDSGTLFAVYSQASGNFMQKAAQSSLLLSVDVILGTLDATNLTFGDTNFSNPPASETVAGVVELADNTEALAGTDLLRAMTPKRVHEAFQQYGLGISKVVSGDIDSVRKSGIYAIYKPYVTGGQLPPQFDGEGLYVASLFVKGDEAVTSFCTQLMVLERYSNAPRIVVRIYDGTTGVQAWSDWFEIFHSGNGGTGSELDADLLDGEHGSFYRDAGNLNAGKIPVARLPAATETAIGAVEKATTEEAQSGAAGKFPDAAGVAAMLKNFGLGYSGPVGFTDFNAYYDGVKSYLSAGSGTTLVNKPPGFINTRTNLLSFGNSSYPAQFASQDGRLAFRADISTGFGESNWREVWHDKNLVPYGLLWSGSASSAQLPAGHPKLGWSYLFVLAGGNARQGSIFWTGQSSQASNWPGYNADDWIRLNDSGLVDTGAGNGLITSIYGWPAPGGEA